MLWAWRTAGGREKECDRQPAQDNRQASKNLGPSSQLAVNPCRIKAVVHRPLWAPQRFSSGARLWVMLYVRMDEELAPLRADPRYAVLERRLRF